MIFCVGIYIITKLENNNIEWFTGTVSGIKEKKNDTLKTEFNIVYDVCSDEEWYFPLLMDIKKSDLYVL